MRFFETYDLLNNYKNELNSRYVVKSGKNNLSTISKKTKIIIVGTFIPEELPFFYMGKNSYIYDAIDIVFGTAMNSYKKKYYKCMNDVEKQQCVNEIKRQLSENTPIAFLDVSSYVLIKEGSKSDKDIKGMVLDKESFKKINKNVAIIAVSELAKTILINNLGFMNAKYLKMFAGRSSEYPKGTSYKDNFIERFKNIK